MTGSPGRGEGEWKQPSLFSRIENQPCRFGHPKGDKDEKPGGLSETSRFSFSSSRQALRGNGSNAPAGAGKRLAMFTHSLRSGYSLLPLPMGLPLVERPQLFVRRAVVFEPIAAPPLAVVGHLYPRKPAGTMVVQVGVEIGRVEALQLGGMLGGDRFVSMCLRTTAPFLPSTKALSVLRCARDLVNSPTSSLFNSFSTR